MNRFPGVRRCAVSTVRKRVAAPTGQKLPSSSDTGLALAVAVLPGRFIGFFNLFGRPQAFGAIVVLAAVVAVPALWVGFCADDYSLIVEIEHKVPSLAERSPLDLYHFASHRAEVERQIRDGPAPWFSDPGATMHFCRPLTSLVFALDHGLWRYHAVGYHITSALLYTALVLCVGLFFRVALGVRRSGPSAVAATLATLLFAVDPHHVMPADWISSRHFVVAAIPAVLALAAHVRFVRDGWKPGFWLGPVGIMVALLGSEAGVGAVVYWLAFDAFGPAPPGRSSPRSRLLSSAPVVAITAIYLGAYVFFGFGSRGGVYRSHHRTGRFLACRCSAGSHAGGSRAVGDSRGGPGRADRVFYRAWIWCRPYCVCPLSARSARRLRYGACRAAVVAAGSCVLVGADIWPAQCAADALPEYRDRVVRCHLDLPRQPATRRRTSVIGAARWTLVSRWGAPRSRPAGVSGGDHATRRRCWRRKGCLRPSRVRSFCDPSRDRSGGP